MSALLDQPSMAAYSVKFTGMLGPKKIFSVLRKCDIDDRIGDVIQRIADLDCDTDAAPLILSSVQASSSDGGGS